MKILAIIPARGGSKGIPRKNIKLLGGKPLLAYTVEVALKIKQLDTLMVSTEDNEIACISSGLGLPVPFMRPAELAQDFTPTVDVVVDILLTYKKQNTFFDAVMILEPTCPFRSVDEINECIDVFKKKDSDSLITVKEVPAQFNPHWVYEDNGECLLNKAIGGESVITRRQILPKAYARDGSLYLVKTDVLLNQHSLYGDSIAYRVNNNPIHINVDGIADWIEAERLMELNKSERHLQVV